MNNEINEQLTALKNEDIIWIVSFFLVILSVLSNQFERNAILENNPRLNNISSDIKIIIFIGVIIINIFFISVIWQNIEKLEQTPCNNEDLKINQARLVATLLFLIGGLIYLITEIQLKTETN